MTNFDTSLLQEMINDRRKNVEREIELATAHHEEVEMMDRMMAEIDRLKRENASLTKEKRELERQADKQESQLTAYRDEASQTKARVSALQVRIDELEKIGKKVAAKTEHDELVKVFRTLVRNAKRKRIEKRAHVKSILMECVLSMHMELPEDLALELDTLDDVDTQEPKVVNNSYVGDITLQAGSTLNGNTAVKLKVEN